MKIIDESPIIMANTIWLTLTLNPLEVRRSCNYEFMTSPGIEYQLLELPPASSKDPLPA